MFNVIPIARTMVIQSMDDAVIVLDADNRVVDVNPAAETVIYWSASEAMGKPVDEVLANQRDLVQQYANVKEERAEIVVGADDDQRVYDLRISTVYRRRQESGRLVVLRDITERTRAEQERESLIAELDAYAQTVAHNLKNPTGVITGYVELIQMTFGDALPSGVHGHLKSIGSTGHKMARIVNELLVLSSIRKMEDVEMSPLAMGELVNGALERLTHHIEKSGAKITEPDAWPVAKGYAPWVEEIWANYLSNAIKYGGSPPMIEVGADEQSDGVVRFWVRDNGIGLAREEQASLFTEFSRLDQHAESEGHGLGLSIVQRIAKKLGGEVGVESDVGKGSTFYFCLPSLNKQH
jgi:PAS domain S-box-containing protein